MHERALESPVLLRGYFTAPLYLIYKTRFLNGIPFLLNIVPFLKHGSLFVQNLFLFEKP